MSYRTRSARYRPYRSSMRRRAYGNQRAADQQRDSMQVTINQNISFDCGQNMYDYGGSLNTDEFADTGCAAINIYDVLRKSDYFIQFSEMYDQIKIENIRAKIIATNWATSKEESSTEKINEIVKSRSYIIVTAWDRTGLSPEQIIKDPYWGKEIGNPNFDPTKPDGPDNPRLIISPFNYRFWTKISRSITSYSSAKTKHLGPGNAYEIVRQLYPENNWEKSQFVSTKLLIPQYDRSNDAAFTYNCFYRTVGGTLKGFDWNEKYPTNILSNPSCPFKPTLLVNVIPGPSPQVITYDEPDPYGLNRQLAIGINKIKPVTFDVEFDIVVTFRGLRYNRLVDYVPQPEPEPIPQYVEPASVAAESDTIGDPIRNNTDIYQIRVNNSANIPLDPNDEEKKTELVTSRPYDFNGTHVVDKPADPEEITWFVYFNKQVKTLTCRAVDYPDGTAQTDITLTNDELFVYCIDGKINSNYINLAFYTQTAGENPQPLFVIGYSIPLIEKTYWLNSHLIVQNPQPEPEPEPGS